MDSKQFNIKSRYNYVPKFDEVNTLPSKTMPDQSTDLRILVQRQRNGQEVRQYQPQFDGITDLETEYPNWETMDKIEREIVLNQVRNNINNIRNKLTKTAKDKIYEDLKKDAERELANATKDDKKVEV